MKIPDRMRAAVLFGPGDIRVIEVEVPSPGPEEVLLKVEACAICGSDPKIISNGWPWAPPFGNFIPGHEYAGKVVFVGSEITEFEVGDRVVIEPHKGCGRCQNCIIGLYTTCLNYGNKKKGHRHYGFSTNGGYAEYAVNHINSLHHLPDNIGFDEATLLTTIGTGLYGIEKIGGIFPGETVTIIGPGPIGLACLRLAYILGAGKVFLAGTRKSRLVAGKKLGADEVIDIKNTELISKIDELTFKAGSDLVIECSGSADGASNAIKIVKKNGRICFLGMYNEDVTIDLNRAVQYNLQMGAGKAEGKWSIERAIPLMADGRLKLAKIITHKFPLINIDDAINTFKNRIGGAIKVVINP